MVDKGIGTEDISLREAAQSHSEEGVGEARGTGSGTANNCMHTPSTLECPFMFCTQTHLDTGFCYVLGRCGKKMPTSLLKQSYKLC